MSLVTTMLSTIGGGGSGGGGSSVNGVILLPAIAASTTTLIATYANGSSGIGATLTNGSPVLTAARVATTGALTVSYNNGASGVGATLTNAGAQAAIAIDSVTLSASDRVLVKNQATAAQNGVYSVTDIGSGSTNWVLTRVTDFDQAAEMIAGTEIGVTAGTTNAGTLWLLSTTVTTVGSDNVTFGATAAISLDGVSPTAGQRVLIKDQTSGLQNGIYSVTTVGSATTNWVLTRTSDFDEPGEVTVGVMVAVATGTANGATLWEQTATVAAIGTDTITFTEFANATLTTATIGNINITANTISSTNAGGDIILTPTTTGQVEFGANSTKASRTRWREDTDNGTNYITWGAPSSLAGDTDYTFQTAYPTVSGYMWTSDTSGTSSWTPPSKEVVIDQTTTPVTIVANQVYIANNAGLVTLNMPATAAVGDIFEVDGLGAGGWLLRMNTGQVANLGSSPTTSAGSLASTNRYDGVKIRCVATDTTFVALRAVGNLTVA